MNFWIMCIYLNLSQGREVVVQRLVVTCNKAQICWPLLVLQMALAASLKPDPALIQLLLQS